MIFIYNAICIINKKTKNKTFKIIYNKMIKRDKAQLQLLSIKKFLLFKTEFLNENISIVYHIIFD